MNTVSTNVAGDASIAVTTINDNKRETLYISVENPPLRRPRRSFRGAVFMGGRDNGGVHPVGETIEVCSSWLSRDCGSCV
jgi:hypothetical protein